MREILFRAKSGQTWYYGGVFCKRVYLGAIGRDEYNIHWYIGTEDGDIIKVLKVEGFSGNEIILTETIDPETIEPRYKRECIGDYLEPIGKILRQDIFVEVFYKP